MLKPTGSSLAGMFKALMKGKAKYGHAWLPKRRARHIKSQMKYFGSAKYGWDYAKNKKRDTSLWKM